MKRNEDFRNALGQPDEYFRQAVLDTLDQLNTQAEKDSRPQGRTYIRFACACAAMVLLCTGIILTCRRPGGPLDNHVDTVNPTTAVLARPSGVTVVETEQATLVIDRVVRDGFRILIPVQAQPKREGCIILTADYTLDPTDYRETEWEYYGIQPGEDDTSLREWVRNRDWREALTVHVNSPRNYTTSTTPFYGAFHNEDVRLMEDGSVRMTIVGAYVPDTDVYDLEWEVIPWNLEENGGISASGKAEHGFIQAELAETESLSASVPQTDAPAAETDTATLTFMNAVRDRDGVILMVEVRPNRANCLVWTDMVRMHTALEATRGFYGVPEDEPYQNLYDWIGRRGYRETISVEFCPAGEGNSPDYDNLCDIRKCLIREDGSAVVTVIIKDIPETGTVDMKCLITCWKTSEDGTGMGGDPPEEVDFRVVIPEQEGDGTVQVCLTKEQ